ncbi:Flp pilus assembly protein TadG [Novosphingobium kunmingense]|uniref:Flp pilus assembly protein TadG n=1 Tax=Novosphingobium kunmingense TaxID=1211806 RepID=A0A2N0H6I1_9SPHN|nr:TadE/TadG family type IV pilus assembly protein [Novosphingobium kunmingense]PKB14519.1 Flp pilus assembly protein TadG [Novosphingobium kunmingense]
MGIAALLDDFRTDRTAGSAAEFSLVLPLLLIFLFGIIDVGGYAWAINKAEKATQMGTRMAVVTDPAATGLASYSYVGKTIGGVTLTQGDVIPADSMVITCTSASCTCTGCPTGMSISKNNANFTSIVTRMQAFDPGIVAANVEILYRSAGLGYAGDPSGMEIAPLVTVRLTGRTYAPFTLYLIKAAVPLPSFSYSLPMEDGSGSVSN